MTAPTAPSATSVAQTAAQAAAILDAGTTGIWYVYWEAAGVLGAPGFTSAALLAALKFAPHTSTAQTKDNVVTALNANDTGAIYAFLDENAPAGNGFLVTDLKAALGTIQSFAPAGSSSSLVAIYKNAAIYTTPGVIDTPELLYPNGTVVEVSGPTKVSGALWYKILYGSYINKYVRYEDILRLRR